MRGSKLYDELLGVNVAPLDFFFKAREVFNKIRVGGPFAVRLDAVSASRVFAGFSSEEGNVRSFRVHYALVRGAAELMQRFNCLCAYVASDEVNVVCRDAPYKGRVEKIDSVFASTLSSAVSLELGVPVSFDARVILLRDGECLSYIVYRARVAYNNYISTLYHRVSQRKETPSLREMLGKLNLLGVDLGEPWMAVGTSLCWAQAAKEVGGTTATRRRLVAVDGLECCLRDCGDDEPST